MRKQFAESATVKWRIWEECYMRNIIMRKKILAVGAVSLVITGIASDHVFANAEGTKMIHSKGNIVLEDGSSMAVYSEDIDYLRQEIEALFREIPVSHNGVEAGLVFGEE